MRKLVFLFIFIFAMFTPVHAHAESPVRLVIDGAEVHDLPAPPIILNDRTLVPVREVFERVGGVVGWHAGHRQVSLFVGDCVLVMTIDELTASLNGEHIEMHIPPIIHNDRTMVPLRIIAEALGADVGWDGDARIVSISRDGTRLYLAVDAPLPDGMGVPLIRQSRTFVPLRYVSEALGANVRWDSANFAVYVYEG